MNNIYLIGFMGSGKSYTGKLLAKEMNIYFLDLDQFIEESCNLSIPEIFKNFGEEGFRERESFYLRKTADFKNTLISCGGGTPCFNENMKWIKENGISIYLKTDKNLLFSRLKEQKEDRPLISKMTDIDLKNYIGSKIKEREKFYILADYVSIQEKNKNSLSDIQLFIEDKLKGNRS